MISFNGLLSGLDTQGIINAMTTAQRQPITRLEVRRGGYEAQISQFGEIGSKLSELETMMKDLGELGNVLAFDATTTDEDRISARVDGTAPAGTYAVNVGQVARAEKDRSVALSSQFAPIQAGTITITTPGNDPVEITIDEGDALTEVVDKINSSGAAAHAALLNDGTSTYLQITASEMGHEIGGDADNALVIDEQYTAGSAGDQLGMSRIVSAQNAAVTIDGLDIESRSNTLATAIQGVTLDVVGTGAATINISPNNEGTQETLTAFVDLYNEVVGLVDDATLTTDGARALGADSALLRLRSDLRGMISAPIEGFTGAFDALSQVGIETTSTGSIRLDTAALTAALDADIQDVGRLFSFDGTGVADRMTDLVDRYTNSTDGIFVGRKKALNSRIDGVSRQIERLETRVDRAANTLQRQFTALEVQMSLIQQQGGALNSLLLVGSAPA